MTRTELLEKIEDIQNTSIGQSQTNKIADLIEQEKKDEAINIMKWLGYPIMNYEELHQQFKESMK
jgi:hypothetical protein